jgi:hypothetical protein
MATRIKKKKEGNFYVLNISSTSYPPFAPSLDTTPSPSSPSSPQKKQQVHSCCYYPNFNKNRYERNAIIAWFAKGNQGTPLSARIVSNKIMPNNVLLAVIHQFLVDHEIQVKKT